METFTCALKRDKIISIGERGMIGSTDQAVVERVLKGDKEAFAILVGRYQDRIYSSVLNYVSNPEDAIDITQEAFVRAYSNLKSFNSSSAFYTWLYRIAVNASIDFIRKRKTRAVESLDDERYTEAGFEPVSKDLSTNPEYVARQTEQVGMLRDAISSLSDKLRAAIVLHDIEGLSQEEVAEVLAVPVGTVKSRVARGREELRHKLGKLAGELL